MTTNAAQTDQTKIAVGALFAVTGLLSLAPMAILGPAIGWPASLNAPVVQQITAIAGAPSAVASGYGVYLLYSILILPLMVFLSRVIWREQANPWAQMVIAFAALSVLARCIGISRWLTVLPELARTYVRADGSTDAAMQANIALIFKSISHYGGSIGELLGVSLFMSIALAIAMFGAWSNRALPRWLSLLGLFTALALFGMFLPAVGVAFKVPVVLAVTALSVWMWAFAAWSIATGLRRKTVTVPT